MKKIQFCTSHTLFTDQGDEQAATSFPQRHLGLLLGQPEGAGRHHEAVCHQVSATKGYRRRGAVTQGLGKAFHP